MSDELNLSAATLVGWAGGERATLAVVFTDVVASTATGERHGDETMNQVWDTHLAKSRLLAVHHGGQSVKWLGDGGIAVFRTVEGALDYALSLHGDPGHPELRIRAGIHIGPIQVVGDDIRGREVNFTAGIIGANKGAEIWLSNQAMEHVTGLRAARHRHLQWHRRENVEVKGFGPNTIWAVSPIAPSIAGDPGEEVRRQTRPLGTIRQRRFAAAVSNILIRVPVHFLGRDQALAELDQAFARHQGRIAVTVLHGMRGVGKTVMAATYAERRRDNYRATWWIRAETVPGIRADLVGLAVRLGWVSAEETEEPALAEVGERLRHDGDGILLIYDNAADAGMLTPYLPRGGASHVLITSNARAWRGVATPIELRPWTGETGADFLVARTGQADARADALELSATLGGLPLALEQAGAYCERLEVPLEDYARRFAAEPHRLLDSNRDAPADYHDHLTVAKTFAIAIEAAVELHPAAELLIALCALLPPEPIPIFVLARAREEFDGPLATRLAEDGLDEAIAALRGFGLVEREAIADERDPAVKTDTIRLHRLVREVSSMRYTGEDRGRCALIQALAAVYPREVFNNPAAWARARRLDALALALVGGDTALPVGMELPASYLMNQLALYRHAALEAFDEAQHLYERALEIREVALGLEHPSTALSLNNFAGLLRARGDLTAARRLYERALAIRETAFGPDHPTTALSLANLASLLEDQGDFAAARPLLERALAIHETQSGPKDPHVATDLNNLAALLHLQGDLAGARPMLERALAIRETNLGPRHLDTAQSLSNLAMLVGVQGDAESARPLYERALAIYEEGLGADHPATIRVREDLEDLAGMAG